MSHRFTLEPMDVALPRGAYAGGGRDVLRYDGRPVCAFTRGMFRPCLHPVWTPAGYNVTAEQPADHPHHRGIWVACDHVGLMVDGPDGTERYDYNFYVDEVFQGRAPGHIAQVTLHLVAQAEEQALIEQNLDWIGPPEWGAKTGRHVLRERRWTAISLCQDAFIFDITTDILPAGNDAVTLGPTRHAWFNARLAEAISLDNKSRPIDDRGCKGADEIGKSGASWVAYGGPVGGGAQAGIVVVPQSDNKTRWFVADWGVITVGAIRGRSQPLAVGQSWRSMCRFVAYDGSHRPIDDWSSTAFLTPETMVGDDP